MTQFKKNLFIKFLKSNEASYMDDHISTYSKKYRRNKNIYSLVETKRLFRQENNRAVTGPSENEGEENLLETHV